MKYPLKVNYLCPHCRSYLRIWNNIIFIIKSELRNLNVYYDLKVKQK